MKKTFLVLGLIAGFGAAAQQKDIQDIQDLIQNKQAKDKIKNERIRIFKNDKSNLFSPIVSDVLRTRQSSIYYLPNGDRVIYGSLGGMPIVQPDMRNFTVMPRVNPNNENLPQTMPIAGRLFYDYGVAGPNHIMDQLAPSPILDKLLKNSGK